MEFRIDLVDQTQQQQQAQPPTSAPQPPQQLPQSAAQQPSVPIPQLQSIQQTLLPALAAAAPQLERRLVAEATESSATTPPQEAQAEDRGPALREVAALKVLSEDEIAQIKRQFGAMAGQILAAATIRLPAPAPAPFTLPPLEERTIAHEWKAAEKAVANAPNQEIEPAYASSRQLGEDIGKAAGKAFVDEILPPLEELTLIGREPGDILPALEELHPVAELPGEAAERERRAMREKAMIDYNREGVVDVEAIDEVIDPAMEAAQNRLKRVRQQVREEASYAKITGNEEPVYDVIDPNAEARQKHLAQMNEYLQGGSRVAAQLGMGATGQVLGGAADIGAGIATGNIAQTVSGALQIESAAAHGLAEAFNAATDIMRTYTDSVADLIQNNYIGAFESRLQAASDVMEKIPIYGEAVAAGFNTIVQPLRSFFEITEEFLTRGGKLGEYSPDLAVANAMAEVRSTIADLREANELGPELARMTDNFSQFMTEIREVFLPFKEFLASVTADLWGMLLEYLRDARAVLNKDFMSIFVSELAAAIAKALTGDMSGIEHAANAIKLEVALLRQRYEREHEHDMAQFSEQFYRNLAGLDPGAPGKGEPVFNPAERGVGRQPGLRPDLFPAGGF